MATRQFHIGDILSVTHDRLVSPRHVGGVYDILNHMTGENLFTHQLPRASRACKPSLLSQHPQLNAVNASAVTAENWKAWLDKQVAAFGEMLPVEPLLPNAYDAVDPIKEAVAMVGKDRVIPVKL